MNNFRILRAAVVGCACSSENAVCCRTEQTGFAAEDHSGGVYGILDMYLLAARSRRH